MAARRLIAVMLVLLFLSSLAAALAPPVEEPDEETTTTTTEPLATQPLAGAGELLHEKLDADAKRERTIEATVGDQLQLRVKSRRVATVVIRGIGPTADVGPDAPGQFDVLLNTVDEFPVELLGTNRRIGTIVVSPRALPEPDPAPAHGPT